MARLSTADRWYPAWNCDVLACKAPIGPAGRVLWNADAPPEVVLTGLMVACSDACEAMIRAYSLTAANCSAMTIVRFIVLLAASTLTSTAVSEQIDRLELLAFEQQTRMPGAAGDVGEDPL